MYQRVLIATDGSQLSRKAIAQGVALAKAMGAKVIAVHVLPSHDSRSYFSEDVVVRTDPDPEYEKQALAAAERALAVVRSAASEAGVACDTVLPRNASPADGILEVADEKRCDLIVMASHGRKGIKRVLLGSETQHVLTHSTVPVLVLR